MHLADYMAQRGLDDQRVADEVGTDRSTISRIRRRKTRPDWQTIRRLRQWSDGAITASDFESIEAA